MSSRPEPLPKAPDSQALVPGIAEAIRDRILRGQLRESEVIHQTELARDMGVSPAPLREALRRLEAEGLITFLPYKGTIVAPVTALEVRESFSAAIALGLVMLPHALPRLGENDFEALRILAETLDRGGADLEDVLAFYTLLLRPAGMPMIMEMCRSIIRRSVRIFPLTQTNRLKLQDVRPTRRELVQALASGDIEAAKRAFTEYHEVRCAGLIRALAERDAGP